jgi:hypothetical protein
MWVIEGDRKRCERHKTTFSKLDVCPACTADPGPEIDFAEPEVADPVAVADETWCRDKRDELLAFAQRMTTSVSERESKARIEYSTIAKIYDTALKYHRAAVEAAQTRGDRNHDRWLVKQCRELARRGIAN